MNVREFYRQALNEKGFQSDSAQEAAVERLQELYDDWLLYLEKRARTLHRVFRRRPEIPRGVYMWGGVGRGKSFLMDAFYATVPLKRKVRLHFHEFMREVHNQMRTLKGVSDPLDEVARRLSRRYRLICFDEFHVSDVADAMILYKLLHRLFENGTSFVMTSNYRPDDLYPEGLHRDRILPAIELIKNRLDILNVDSGIDYRRRSLEQVDLYLTPIGPETTARLREIFAYLADNISGQQASAQSSVSAGSTQAAVQAAPSSASGAKSDASGSPAGAWTASGVNEGVDLIVQNRRLHAIAVKGSAAWFDFASLCGSPRSQNDYLELAARFGAIIVSDVPIMKARQASEARRFTWMIDVFYDHRVKVVLSAAAAAEALYTDGPMANEFHRTVSRILEMQSRDYLESEHRAAVAL